ncbi:MAG TPA: hypothetical protein VEF71_03245 [Streptosporangiaceae bacterium]|nr:hypothetical protein [Streptosporangiaceae bacterium]
MAAETGQEQRKRRHQRPLSDRVTGRLRGNPAGYPAHVTDFIVDTARLSASAAVLEISCGTGQLTRSLARPVRAGGFRPDRAGSFFPGGRLEFDHELGWYPAAVLDLNALALGSVPDPGCVQAACSGLAPAPGRALRAGSASSRIDVAGKCGAQCLGVLGVQVDLVLGAVQA